MDRDYLSWIERCLILSVCASVARIVAEHGLEIQLWNDDVGPIVILTGPEQTSTAVWNDLLIAKVPYLYTRREGQIVVRSPLCERPIDPENSSCPCS